MPQTLIDLGIVCGAITVILTTIALVARLPPVQWMWGQLVSRPIGRWAANFVKDGARQFHEASVKPQIDKIERDLADLVEASETSWHKDKAWMVARVVRLEEKQHQLVAGVVAVLERSSLPESGVVHAVLEALNGMMETEAAERRKLRRKTD